MTTPNFTVPQANRAEAARQAFDMLDDCHIAYTFEQALRLAKWIYDARIY